MRYSLPIKLGRQFSRRQSSRSRSIKPKRGGKLPELHRSSQMAIQTIQVHASRRPQKKMPLLLRKFFGVEFHIRKREKIARSLQQLLTENSAYKYWNARVKKISTIGQRYRQVVAWFRFAFNSFPHQSSATNSSFGKKARRSKCMQIFPSRKSVRTPQVLAVWWWTQVSFGRKSLGKRGNLWIRPNWLKQESEKQNMKNSDTPAVKILDRFYAADLSNFRCRLLLKKAGKIRRNAGASFGKKGQTGYNPLLGFAVLHRVRTETSHLLGNQTGYKQVIWLNFTKSQVPNCLRPNEWTPFANGQHRVVR